MVSKSLLLTNDFYIANFFTPNHSQSRNPQVSVLPFPWMSVLYLQICYRLIQRIGEGNGTPLQYSCLENPMVGGA